MKYQPKLIASRFIGPVPISRPDAARFLAKHRRNVSCHVSVAGTKTYRVANNYFDQVCIQIQA